MTINLSYQTVPKTLTMDICFFDNDIDNNINNLSVWVNVCKQICWLITKREWRIKGIDDSCAWSGLCHTLSTAYDVIMFFN